MLLLFWHLLLDQVGTIRDILWFHTESYPPRCICSGEFGLSVINPFLKHPTNKITCAYAYSASNTFNDSCYFHNKILAGSTASGVYGLDCDLIYSVSCDVENPAELGAFLLPEYTLASGLLSSNVLSLDSSGDYLGILTSSGLSWKKYDTEFITYATTSGNSICIAPGPVTYLAEGNTIRIKYGEPTDFTIWDEVKEYPFAVNEIKVDNGVVFAATDGGLDTFTSESNYLYTNLSGTLGISSVCVELGSDMNWGHAFTVSSGNINIVNLKSKEIDEVILTDGGVFLAWAIPRIYHK